MNLRDVNNFTILSIGSISLRCGANLNQDGISRGSHFRNSEQYKIKFSKTFFCPPFSRVKCDFRPVLLECQCWQLWVQPWRTRWHWEHTNSGNIRNLVKFADKLERSRRGISWKSSKNWRGNIWNAPRYTISSWNASDLMEKMAASLGLTDCPLKSDKGPDKTTASNFFSTSKQAWIFNNLMRSSRENIVIDLLKKSTERRVLKLNIVDVRLSHALACFGTTCWVLKGLEWTVEQSDVKKTRLKP